MRTINEQAVLDIVDDLRDRMTVVGYWSVVERVKALPDLQPTCNQLETDCISRQAAIEAMLELQKEDDDAYGCHIPEAFNGERAAEALKSLPSAQPDFDITVKIDKAYDDGYEAGYLQGRHDWGDLDE